MYGLFVLLVRRRILYPWRRQQHKGWKIPGWLRVAAEVGELARSGCLPISLLVKIRV